MMKLPKACLVHDAPDSLWGIVRLRNPVILAEFECLNPDGGVLGFFRPYIWPPDVMALTTPKKFHDCLSALWRMFDDYEGNHNSVEMYRIDLTRELPRYLVLDNDDSDFTGVLDTQDGVLWSVDETCRALTAVLEWRMHPGMKPVLEFPRSTREVMAFWKEFYNAQSALAGDEPRPDEDDGDDFEYEPELDDDDEDLDD